MPEGASTFETVDPATCAEAGRRPAGRPGAAADAPAVAGRRMTFGGRHQSGITTPVDETVESFEMLVNGDLDDLLRRALADEDQSQVQAVAAGRMRMVSTTTARGEQAHPIGPGRLLPRVGAFTRGVRRGGGWSWSLAP